MMLRTLPASAFAAALFLLASASAHATLDGRVQGVVHDPTHRPVAEAQVTLHAANSDYQVVTATQQDGSFRFSAVPLGAYVLTIAENGFATEQRAIEVRSNTTSVLHIELQVAEVRDTVTVTASLEANDMTPTTTVTQENIAATPGAGRTNSVQFITEYTPGAYVTHDMLHMRGGHQVSFLMDGVNIPNTNIASNVAAAISPRDMSTVQIERGSYSAEEGDRTYGVFNIAPKTGFEYDRAGDLTLTAGSQFQTDDQVSFGDHSQRLAWYASANGNRSDYGLAPPIAQTYHDAENGFGAFGTVVYNRNSKDQFRAIAQARRDFFQIPYDPDPDDFENRQYNSSGLRDTQTEQDMFAAATWTHAYSSRAILQASPFYHYNGSNYDPGANDIPVATTSHRSSNYGGGQAQFTGAFGGHSIDGGLYGFGQHDNYLYGLGSPCPPLTSSCATTSASGGIVEGFVGDSWRVWPWLTLQGGVRQSHFQGDITDNFTAPRVGAALQIPKLEWVVRGFYGRFYQPPPLVTLASFLLSGNPFTPLHGERDEEHQFGVTIPWRGWVLDADTFRNRINNFLDHANIGESSIFVPITVDGALVRAWELTLRSPRLYHRAGLHLAYSNQIAEQRGAITGGLLCPPVNPDCAVDPNYTPVDHDQRNTLSVGGDAALPRGFFYALNVSYGSGFVNGDPDPSTPYPNAYLPAHSSVDMSLSRSFSENLSLGITATNIAGERVLLDNSLTFGGFHFNDPRMVYAQLRWKFHF